MKLELSHVELLLELFPLFVELRVFSMRLGKFILDVSPLFAKYSHVGTVVRKLDFGS